MRKQFITMSALTLLSRVLGFFRELLFVRSLGARVVSDAFLTAFRIPNTFYEIVAGGAFGPAIVPTLSYVLRTYGIQGARRLMTVLSIAVSSIVIAVVGITIGMGSWVLAAIVPGFSADQQAVSLSLLRILMHITIFSSMTALCAEALRALRKFTIPACGQIIVNTVFIGALVWYQAYCSSLQQVALIVVLGNFLQLALHLIACYGAGYHFAWPDEHAWRSARHIGSRIIPCMLTAGISEIALFIELQFASYLPVGSVSLLSYASSFSRLPFGIVVHSFATVLLPELSRLQTYAPRRIPYIMSEAYKVMIWILSPLVFLMFWFSYDIFATLYLSRTFPLQQVLLVQKLFLIKLSSIFFLALNHLVLQFFYARHETGVPTVVSLLSAGMSICFNLVMTPLLGVYGLALSSTVAAGFRTVLLCFIAQRRMHARYTCRHGVQFLKGLLLQFCCIMLPLVLGIEYVRSLLRCMHLPAALWLADGVGLWLWVALLCVGAAMALWSTRSWYAVRLRLLERRMA